MRKGFSIVVCCYNSEKLLPETLKHLAALQLNDEFAAEVILVDNNSTDNTAITARKLWDGFTTSIPLKVTMQPVPGLNFARSKGIEESAFNYILFCDDDNWLFPDYLQRAFQVLEMNENIGVLGGQGIAECEIVPPDDVKPFLGAFATGPQAPESGDVTHTRTSVYGAGSIYRKNILRLIHDEGFQPYLSDRKGDILTSGGDAELCWAILLRGFKIWYDSGLKFKHFLIAKRLNQAYLSRLEFGNGFSSALHVPYWELISGSKRSAIKNTWWWRLTAAYIIYFNYVVKHRSLTGKSTYERLSQLRLKGYRKGLWACRKEYKKLQEALKTAEWVQLNQVNNESNQY